MSCTGCPFRGIPQMCGSCGVFRKDKIVDKNASLPATRKRPKHKLLPGETEEVAPPKGKEI